MLDSDFKIFGNCLCVKNREEVVVTFGNFDGVHAGHQKLLRELSLFADGRPKVVFTFDPHPSRFFNPTSPKPLLTDLDKRVELLLAAGADTVFVKTFDSAFAGLSADEFCLNYLPSVFNIYGVLLGFNFCYGQSREGCWSHFLPIAKRFGWKVQKSEPLLIEQVEVSSTKIRELILEGNVALAAEFLGRFYSISGTVVPGRRMGRILGFPTANLCLSSELLPANGVYACVVQVEGIPKSFLGVLNYGARPTVGRDFVIQAEVHILDFNADIYGKQASVLLVKYMRPEVAFSSLDDLKGQISRDVCEARNFFLEQAEKLGHLGL